MRLIALKKQKSLFEEEKNYLKEMVYLFNQDQFPIKPRGNYQSNTRIYSCIILKIATTNERRRYADFKTRGKKYLTLCKGFRRNTLL